MVSAILKYGTLFAMTFLPGVTCHTQCGHQTVSLAQKVLKERQEIDLRNHSGHCLSIMLSDEEYDNDLTAPTAGSVISY